ncbi:MAG TPA: hypothetical protein VGV87_25140 [Blastocatellia bacterium]|nr:hypothetical protein [Blastocatellia bacterium]
MNILGRRRFPPRPLSSLPRDVGLGAGVVSDAEATPLAGRVARANRASTEQTGSREPFEAQGEWNDQSRQRGAGSVIVGYRPVAGNHAV